MQDHKGPAYSMCLEKENRPQGSAIKLGKVVKSPLLGVEFAFLMKSVIIVEFDKFLLNRNAVAYRMD